MPETDHSLLLPGILPFNELSLKAPSKTFRGVSREIRNWGSPKANHIKASQPHFLHFPRFRVRIFCIFCVFALWISSDPG